MSVRDGLPEQTPNADIADLVGVERPLDFGGNLVVVRIGPGVYAHYNHLQPRSMDVRNGEHVKTGQLIGKLGNSGNSTGPHLHFGLNTGPEGFTSNSLSVRVRPLHVGGFGRPGEEHASEPPHRGHAPHREKELSVTYSRAQDERVYFKIPQTYAHFRRHDAAWVLIYNHKSI